MRSVTSFFECKPCLALGWPGSGGGDEYVPLSHYRATLGHSWQDVVWQKEETRHKFLTLQRILRGKATSRSLLGVPVGRCGYPRCCHPHSTSQRTRFFDNPEQHLFFSQSSTRHLLPISLLKLPYSVSLFFVTLTSSANPNPTSPANHHRASLS